MMNVEYGERGATNRRVGEAIARFLHLLQREVNSNMKFRVPISSEFAATSDLQSLFPQTTKSTRLTPEISKRHPLANKRGVPDEFRE
jgi:hypothetical protein